MRWAGEVGPSEAAWLLVLILGITSPLLQQTPEYTQIGTPVQRERPSSPNDTMLISRDFR